MSHRVGATTAKALLLDPPTSQVFLTERLHSRPPLSAMEFRLVLAGWDGPSSNPDPCHGGLYRS